MVNQRLFVAQVVTGVEEQWFAPGTDGPPIRTERCYGIEQALFAAADEDDAYRLVSEWLENDAFSDMDHDGIGDLRRFFGVGLHQLEEVGTLQDFPDVVCGVYGVSLSVFNLTDVDANGVPLVRVKEQLEVFRLRRITRGSP